jgi:hypothetical protein
MEPQDTSASAEQQGDNEAQARREFISKIGKAGAAAPAVALLMAANFKSAHAQTTYGGGGGCGCGCGSGVIGGQ